MSNAANTPNANPPREPAGGVVLTKQQLAVILVSGVLLLAFLVAAVVFLLVASKRSVSGSFPTLAPVNAGLPTSTIRAASVPTYSYRATITPIPTPTPFAYRPANLNPGSGAGAVQPAQQSGYSPNCQAQLDYAASVHQSNISYFKSYYQPWINYYQDLLNQALQTRDAAAVIQAQNGANQVQSQLQSALSDESARYKKEVAAIKASC